MHRAAAQQRPWIPPEVARIARERDRLGGATCSIVTHEETWLRTVFSDRDIRRAIVALWAPPATSEGTSRSQPGELRERPRPRDTAPR